MVAFPTKKTKPKKVKAFFWLLETEGLWHHRSDFSLRSSSFGPAEDAKLCSAEHVQGTTRDAGTTKDASTNAPGAQRRSICLCRLFLGGVIGCFFVQVTLGFGFSLFFFSVPGVLVCFFFKPLAQGNLLGF